MCTHVCVHVCTRVHACMHMCMLILCWPRKCISYSASWPNKFGSLCLRQLRARYRSVTQCGSLGWTVSVVWGAGEGSLVNHRRVLRVMGQLWPLTQTLRESQGLCSSWWLDRQDPRRKRSPDSVKEQSQHSVMSPGHSPWDSLGADTGPGSVPSTRFLHQWNDIRGNILARKSSPSVALMGSPRGP